MKSRNTTLQLASQITIGVVSSLLGNYLWSLCSIIDVLQFLSHLFHMLN